MSIHFKGKEISFVRASIGISTIATKDAVFLN